MINSQSLVKRLKDIGKESCKGDMRKGGWDITCLHIFSVTCYTFEILREET